MSKMGRDVDSRLFKKTQSMQALLLFVIALVVTSMAQDTTSNPAMNRALSESIAKADAAFQKGDCATAMRQYEQIMVWFFFL